MEQMNKVNMCEGEMMKRFGIDNIIICVVIGFTVMNYLTARNLAIYFEKKYLREYQKIIDCEKNSPVSIVRCELEAVQVFMGERKMKAKKLRNH